MPPKEDNESPEAQTGSSAVDRLRASALVRKIRLLLPTLLLTAALSATFALTINPAHYYAPLEWDTAKNMAIVENLSHEHNFRMFIRVALGGDGEQYYFMYSRFPISGFLLIKLLTLPFGDDLAAKVFAGRMLMLALFSASAFLAYYALARIVSNRWIAAAAALISFSSYYVLTFSTWVSNEMMGGLFGIMLTFHGIVVFTQEGRFRQLALKACVALLLDWRVYALLIAFIALGLAKDLLAREGSEHRARFRRVAAVLRRSLHLRLGAVALLFGVTLLTLNVISEYDALNGRVSLTELPSARSAFSKLSLDAGSGFPWGEFLREQPYRIVGASAPYWLTNWPSEKLERLPGGPPLFLVGAGFLLLAASLVGLRFMRRDRIPLASIALAGFVWAMLARANALDHLYESIYWIGVPLTLSALLLLAARRIGFARLIPAAALASALLFALSANQMLARGPDAQREIERQQAIISDMANIRGILARGGVIIANSYDESKAFHENYTLDAYLSGNYIYGSYNSDLPNEYYTLITHHRDDNGRLLTPENRFVFLYDSMRPGDLRRSWVASIRNGLSDPPAAVSGFDLSIDGDALIYWKEPCERADLAGKIWLDIFPERAADLPEWRRESGHDRMDFPFLYWGVMFEGACGARVPLPDYPIAGVRTWQFTEDEGELWNAAFVFDPGVYRNAYDKAATREPDARGAFDLHLDAEERTLTYVKEPCAPSDIAERFFLHIFPDHAGDIPDPDAGYENRDFDFRLNGAVFDGKCAGIAPLPDYPIAAARTGQFSGEGELWNAAFAFDPGAYRAAYAQAATREPDARGSFDLYLDAEERTLTYVKEPCAPSDAERPFFLHVTPSSERDLPRERRELGFETRDFDFRLRGTVFNETCVARVPLPEYAISRIRTGQWIRGEGEIWEAALETRP